MLRPADGCRRIHGNDLSRHEKIEQHPDRGQVLFHRGGRHRVIFDIRGNDDRLDRFQRFHIMALAPGEKLQNGVRIRRPRVAIPDRRREEFDEAPRGGLTGPANGSRQTLKASAREIPPGDGDELGTDGRAAVEPRRR